MTTIESGIGAPVLRKLFRVKKGSGIGQVYSAEVCDNYFFEKVERGTVDNNRWKEDNESDEERRP